MESKHGGAPVKWATASIALSCVCILGLPRILDAQTPQFIGTAANGSGGYFSSDGSGCASVVLRLQETVGGGGSPTPIEAISLSVAHDPALLTVISIEASPVLVTALGFEPQAFAEACSGGSTIGIIFTPDLVSTPTPLTFATGMEIAVVRYHTVPAAFVGMTTPVATAISWVTNACGAAIPVVSGVTSAGGGSQIALATRVPGTVTLVPGDSFIRGNANADASANPVDIADAVFILGYLFSGGPTPACLRAADANDDESVDLGDAVFILAGLFSGGPAPSAPYPSCGPDPTPGALTCDGFPPCCPSGPPQIPGVTFVGVNTQGYEEYEQEIDPSGVVDPITFIRIPAGTFDMGQVGVQTPVHQVTLTQDYLISKYEITNAQYKLFCDQTRFPPPPPVVGCCGWPSDHYTNPLYASHPVVMVSWDDLNAPNGFLWWTGLELPTESQWEYAARGNDGRTYPWGSAAPDAGLVYRANYCQWNGSTCTSLDGFMVTNPVIAAEYSGFESPFGTAGQAGNVREWVADWWDEYPSGAVTNPTGPPSGSGRVLRGGDWSDNDFSLMSASRPGGHNPSARMHFLGFRPARVIP
jgi:iron(II)-dependent oxidoreductase